MQVETTLEEFEHNVWGYHFPIHETIANGLINGKDRRVICSVNNQVTFHCALMPYPNGFFILINKPNVKKLNLKTGDKVTLTLEKDTSEYGMPAPESFLTLLNQDDSGSALFHQLTPGKQRNLIYLVSQVKNIDSQINKGLAILDHLKETKGKLDFKQLMAKIKLYNKRSRLNN